MFTGIVQGTASVVAIEEKANFRVHKMKLPKALLKVLSSELLSPTTAAV